MQMWISWTLGLQSIVETSTNKQEYRMIHIYQFFNKPVVNSSMIVHMAHEMLKHQCMATFCTKFSQVCKFIDNSAHGTSNAGRSSTVLGGGGYSTKAR